MAIGNLMTLWVWPGIALVDAAAIGALPRLGWWLAGTATVLALSAEFIGSSMKPASLILPTTFLTISAALIIAAGHAA